MHALTPFYESREYWWFPLYAVFVVHELWLCAITVVKEYLYAQAEEQYTIH